MKFLAWFWSSKPTFDFWLRGWVSREGNAIDTCGGWFEPSLRVREAFVFVTNRQDVDRPLPEVPDGKNRP